MSSSSVPEDTDGDGTCDLIDADDDGDGVGDPNDAFPKDSSEWQDRNGDGLGDRAHPLSIIDHMKLNPIITGILLFAVLGAIGAAVLMKNRKDQSSTELWRDDDYSRYQEATNTEYSEEATDEQPTMTAETPERLPEQTTEVEPIRVSEKPPPPPPPGFEDIDNSPSKLTVRADSWEDLPDGGYYVQTEPMRYVGEDCGTWIRQEDDSWILEE